MSESKGSRSKSSPHWRSQTTAMGRNQNPPSKEISAKNSGYKIAAYVRLSPTDEIREEGSLVSHPQRIRDFVKYKNASHPGWGEIVEIYVDKDLSGKNMKRPAFIKMCKDMKDGKINAVIATELSRLSRNLNDFCQFWEFLKERQIKLITLKENCDTSTPMGELTIMQAVNFAQFERHTTVARTTDGAYARALRGLANGGPRMLGFDPHPSHRCNLIVNESEIGYARLIFEKMLEHKTIRGVQKFLNDNGYRTKEYVTLEGVKRGGKKWSCSTLHHLLTNMRYIGKKEINKRGNLYKSVTGEIPQYTVVDAKWPAIIPLELFESVQNLLVSNRSKTRRYTHQYRLSGMIYCGECGNRLIGSSAYGKSKKFYYYAHLRKNTHHNDKSLKKCSAERIPALLLEELIIERLSILSQDKDLLRELALASRKNFGDKIESTKSLLLSKEQQKRKSKERIEGLIEAVAFSTGSIDAKQLLVQKIDEENDSLKRIETELEVLKQEQRSMDPDLIDLESVFKLLASFRKSFQTKPGHLQSEILKDIIHRVTIGTNDKIILEYFGSKQSEIDISGLQNKKGAAPTNGATPFFNFTRSPSDLARSKVRTLYEMVGDERLELPTLTV